MTALENWKNSREQVTLDITLPLDAVTEVDFYEKYAFADDLSSEDGRNQIELEVVGDQLVAHIHAYKLNMPPRDTKDYDADEYDTLSTMLDIAVFRHSEPYPDQDYQIEEDPYWSPLTLVATIPVNGVLYDVVALYHED